MASVLEVIQGVAMKIGVSRPEAVFASTEREHQELAALANEVADRIAHAYDWSRMKVLETITGDGSETEFDLPDDYSRMPADQGIYSTSWNFEPLRQVTDHNQWLQEINQSFTSSPPAWTLLGGQIVFNPAPAASEDMRYYYMSNLYCRSSSTVGNDFFPLNLPFEFPDGSEGTRKASFTEDGDAFQLDDRLLRLGMIWQWKADKGQPYAEDMENYGVHLQQRIAADIAPRRVSMGRQRRRETNIWPWQITE
jgi:hypothetical protein